VCRDQKINRVALVIGEELVAQLTRGAGVAKKLPSAERWRQRIELGDGLGERVDRGGDLCPVIEHGIDA